MTLRRKLKWRIFSLLGWFNYFGIKIYFPQDSGAFHAACREGIYENTNVRLLNTLIQPDTTCFDVGANIGLMAAPILAWRTDCRIVSFEPSPTVLGFLERTVKESHYGDRWQLIGKAVGAGRGTTEFFVGAEAGALYDGLKNTNRAGAASSRQVEITTLDDEWKRMGQPRISAIKIDVEGNEIDVLNGAVECIRSEQPTILMEWNAINFAPYQRESEDLLTFANSVGYLVFAMSNLALMESLPVLELNMLRTENFLLRPAQAWTKNSKAPPAEPIAA